MTRFHSAVRSWAFLIQRALLSVHEARSRVFHESLEQPAELHSTPYRTRTTIRASLYDIYTFGLYMS